jgi:transcriptional regulator with XRE-family HTH domain
MIKPFTQIVADNIRKAFAASEFTSYRQLAKAADLAPNTVRNVTEPTSRQPGARGEGAPRLDVVEKLARTMGYEAWQLMVENFEPADHEVSVISQREVPPYRCLEATQAPTASQDSQHIQIGTRLRKLREEQKISQADMAKAAGVTVSALSQLENGVSKNPRPNTLLGIARRLGRSVESLIDPAADATQPPKGLGPQALQLATWFDSLSDKQQRQVIDMGSRRSSRGKNIDTSGKSLSERLAEARKHLGWTQAVLAERAGVSQSTIGNLESGTRSRPRNLLAIASALGVSAVWLEFGTGRTFADSPRLRSDVDELASLIQSYLTEEQVAKLREFVLALVADMTRTSSKRP